MACVGLSCLTLACNFTEKPSEPSASALLSSGQADLGSAEGRKFLFQAVAKFRSAKDKPGQAEALYALAEAHQLAGMAGAALKAIKAAQRTFSENSGSYSPRTARQLEAQLELQLGHMDKAQALYEQLYLQAIKDRDVAAQWQTLLSLGRARAGLKQFASAQEAFGTALKLAAGAPAASRALILQHWASNESNHGQLDAARAHWGQALVLLNGRPLQHQAAQLLLKWGQRELSAHNYSAAALAAVQGRQRIASSPQGATALASELDKLLSESEYWLDLAAENDRLDHSVATEISEAIVPLGDHKFQLQRWLVELFLADTGQLSKTARLVPEEADGKGAAVSIFGVRVHTLWGKLGFENGDRLQSINGFNWADIQNMSAIDLGFPSAVRYVVSLTRADAEMTLEFVVPPQAPVAAD